jgi:hypothetical protein
MTMHRRPLGAARRLAGFAAILLIVACFLPWWHVGGGPDELPVNGGNAFAGSGIVVFFVALAVIALLALPYAAGDVPVAIDRPLSFTVLAVVGWLALVFRAIDVAMVNVEAILPTRAYGLWLAVLGLLVLSRAVYNIRREHRY